MTDKLGSLLVWALFLGLCHMVARPALPFVVAVLGLCIVLIILAGALSDKAPKE